MIQSPRICGFSAGANPRKDEIYLFALRGSVWDVAVFPPIEYPSIFAFFPEPSETTVSRIARTVSEVSCDTILFSGGYWIFCAFVPSLLLTVTPK